MSEQKEETNLLTFILILKTMKKSLIKFTLAVASCVMLFGCSHQYYAPNTQQVPMFTEKNQWQATGSTSFGNEVQATDIGVAYSVASHVALMGDVNWMRGTWSDQKNFMKSGYAEFAVGYFTKIDRYGVFEIYGGLGRNAQHHQFGYDSVTADLNYTKFFIQPVIGYKKGKIEAGFSFRISQINYTKRAGGDSQYEERTLPDQSTYTLIEPAFTFRVGGENVKFQFQRQLSSPLSFDNPKWQYTPSLWSFGIHFAFGTPMDDRN